MNEVTKPNDIFLSTMMNGELNPLDLTANGLDASNTGLLTPESYKESPFIQKQFSDENGVFNELAFNDTYLKAAQQYQDLVNIKTYLDLESYVEYNMNDLYAPIGAKKSTPQFELSKEINPTGVSEGVYTLFGKGVSDKSIRELAQNSKIWDSTNQKWLDETANDRGVLKSLFGQSLVYATWDEDGVHEDPVTGRQVKHKKGDWKINEEGQYYTETIGNRSGYGKQFVAATDTLTKDGSALNKIDFFDSDGLEKSVAGTTFKALSNIGMYLIPGVNVVWGATTAALSLASVMPAFAKMLEGIAVGGDADSETKFTKAMNSWENYFKKFDPSYSDEDQTSNWNYAKITDTVSDIFGQLYQMNAAASLSKVFTKNPLQQAIEKFNKEFLPKYIKSASKPGSALEFSAKEFQEIYQQAASKMPEVKKLLEKQSKLAHRLSLGYMALTSSADVYQDAIEGGYDRRMAGLAGLVATAGQYGIMMNNRMGDWFLKATTGYTKEVNRSLTRKVLRPLYDEFAKGIKTIEQQTDTNGKIKVLGKLFSKANKGFKDIFTAVRDGSEPFWKNAIVESVEEVTEEAVMDATKGIFDFLTWAGIGKNKNASFGGLERIFSQEGLERYALNAFGGFLGGALFELQGKTIEPWITAKLTGKSQPEVQPSFIRLIADGRIDELYKMADELGKADNDVSYLPVTVNGKDVQYSAGKQDTTRGQRAANMLKDYLKMLEGIMIDENANLSEEDILKKTVRDYQAIKILENSGIHKLLISDFTQLTSEIASIRSELKSRSEDSKKEDSKKEEPKTKSANEESKENKKENPALKTSENVDYAKMSTEQLKEQLTEKRKQLDEFLTGNNGEDYLKLALAYYIPEIRNALGNVSLYRYTQVKYDKNFIDLKKDEQDRIRKEWENWKSETNQEKKFLNFGVKAFDKFVTDYYGSIEDYDKNYKELGRKILDDVLSESTYLIGDLLANDNEAYKVLSNFVTLLKSSGRGGLKVSDIFKQDPVRLKKQLKAIIDGDPLAKKILLKSGNTEEEIINVITTDFLNLLESANFGEFGGDALYVQLKNSLVGFLAKSFEKIQEEKGIKFNRQSLLEYLKSENVDITGLDLNIEDQAEISPEEEQNYLRDLFISIFSPEVNKENLGLNTSVLLNFLEQQDVIDSDLLKNLQESALKEIVSVITAETDKNSKLNQELIEKIGSPIIFQQGEEEFADVFKLSKDSIKILKDKIELNYGETPIKNIVDSFVNELFDKSNPLSNYAKELYRSLNDDSEEIYFDSESKFTDEKTLIEDIKDLVSKTITNYIVKNSELNSIYEKVKTKKTLTNPLFEVLRKLDLQLYEGVSVRALDVLENQEKNLYSAERFQDFLMPELIKEQIENILQEILIIKAIVYSARDANPDLEDPFSYNKQIIRYLEKHKQGKNKEKYGLLSEDTIQQINAKELARLEQRCKLFLTIQENNFVSKLQMDANTSNHVSKLFLDSILAEGAKLTIKGVSVLPTYQELESQETNEGKLELIEFKLRDTFIKLSPVEKREALKELIECLNIDLKAILNERMTASILSENLKMLNDRDKLNWLAAALGRNVKDFLWVKKSIDADSNNDKIPLFVQKLVAKQAWASATDTTKVAGADGEGEFTVHDVLVDMLYEAAGESSPLIKTKGITFINGITGAGKTSVGGGYIVAGTPNKIVYVAAPNKTQVDNYVESIKKYSKQPELIQSGNIDQFLELFFDKTILAQLKEDSDKDYNEGETESKFFKSRNVKVTVNKDLDPNKSALESGKEEREHNISELKVDAVPFKTDIDENILPQLILIDEATHLTAAQITLLSKIHDQYKCNFVLSGDTAQNGSIQKADNDNFADLFMWTSPKLNVSVRANNNQKQKNNQKLHNASAEYKRLSNIYGSGSSSIDVKLKEYLQGEALKLDISYYENDSLIVGDKFVTNLLDHIDDLKKLLAQARSKKDKVSGDKWKVGVITDLDDEGNPISGNNIISILKDAGFNPDEYDLFSPKSIHDKAVQGSEREIFIIDSLPLTGNLGEDIKTLYTFASRSLTASLIKLKDSNRIGLGIRNIKEKVTHVDELPLLQQRQKLIDKEIAYIDKFLDGYVKKDPGTISTIEVNGKKIPVRSSKKSTKTTTEKKSTTSTTPTIVSDAEKTVIELDEDIFDEEFEAVKYADPNVVIEEEERNRESKQYIKPFDTKGMICWTFLDHTGLVKSTEKDKSGKVIDGLLAVDTRKQNNFGLNGLINPKATLSKYSEPYIGYQRLIKLLLALNPNESVHDQLVTAIENDECVAKFFHTINPLIWHAAKQIANDNRTLQEVIADWARDNHLDIEDNKVYVLAKRFDKATDHSLTVSDLDDSKYPNDGLVVLHLAVRLSTNDPSDSSFINQYLSLGRFSDGQVNGEFKQWNSDAFNQTYKEAYDILKDIPETNHIVVSELQGQDVRKLLADSMFWVKKHNDFNFFEDLFDQERKGALVDSEHVVLLDNAKVNVEGFAEPQFRSLVLIAALDAESDEIIGNEITTKKTFEEKLNYLNSKFIAVSPDGEKYCTLSGQYLTLVDFVNPEYGGKRFRRAIIQNVKETNPEKVFEDLEFKITQDVTQYKLRSKLIRANPKSQANLICHLILQSIEDDSGFDFNKKRDAVKRLLDVVLRLIPDSRRKTKDVLLLADLIKKVDNGEISSLDDFKKLLLYNTSPGIRPLKFLLAYFNNALVLTNKEDNKKYVVHVPENLTSKTPVDKKGRLTWKSKPLDFSKMEMCVANPLIDSVTPVLDFSEIIDKKYAEKITGDAGLNFFKIDMSVKGIKSLLGLKGYFIESPRLKISEEILASHLSFKSGELPQSTADNVEEKWKLQDISMLYFIEPEGFNEKRSLYLAETVLHNNPINPDTFYIKDPNYDLYLVWHLKDSKDKKKSKGKKDTVKKIPDKEKYPVKYEYSATNNLGWNVRSGDYVLLYGREDAIFRISWLDPKTKKFKVDNTINMEPYRKGKINDKLTPIDAITRVVHRTYNVDVERNEDPYNTKKITSSLLNLEEYKKLRIPHDKFVDLLNDTDASKKLFNFENEIIFVVPVTDYNLEYVDVTVSDLEHRGYINLDTVKSAINEINRDPKYKGYKIIKVFTTNSNIQTETKGKFSLEKIVKEINKANENYLAQQTGSWINRIVYKDFDEYQQTFARVSESAHDVEYDINQIKEDIASDPTGKSYQLTISDMNRRNNNYFPSDYFIYDSHTKKLYPKSAMFKTKETMTVAGEDGNSYKVSIVNTLVSLIKLMENMALSWILKYVGRPVWRFNMNGNPQIFNSTDKPIKYYIESIVKTKNLQTSADTWHMVNFKAKNSSGEWYSFSIPLWEVLTERWRYMFNYESNADELPSLTDILNGESNPLPESQETPSIPESKPELQNIIFEDDVDKLDDNTPKNNLSLVSLQQKSTKKLITEKDIESTLKVKKPGIIITPELVTIILENGLSKNDFNMLSYNKQNKEFIVSKLAKSDIKEKLENLAKYLNNNCLI